MLRVFSCAVVLLLAFMAVTGTHTGVAAAKGLPPTNVTVQSGSIVVSTTAHTAGQRSCGADARIPVVAHGMSSSVPDRRGSGLGDLSRAPALTYRSAAQARYVSSARDDQTTSRAVC